MIYLILIIILLILSTLAIAGHSLAPWVPTWNKDLKRIFKLADLKPNEVFYDLGCGTGKLTIYAHKNFQAKSIGIEMALPFFLICKLRQFFNKDKDLIFKWKNLYKENLVQADVVYVFGIPKTLQHKLKPKLKKELRPGTKVISYAFPIEGWIPKQIDKPEREIAIYLYTL